MVLAPEHPLVESLTSGNKHRQPVDDYRAIAASRSELERWKPIEKSQVFSRVPMLSTLSTRCASPSGSRIMS